MAGAIGALTQCEVMGVCSELGLSAGCRESSLSGADSQSLGFQGRQCGFQEWECTNGQG